METEYERLKKQKENIEKKQAAIIHQNCIPKDRVREKREHLLHEYENDNLDATEYDQIEKQIDLCNELLGES